MSFGFTIDTSGLDAFRKAWPQQMQRALAHTAEQAEGMAADRAAMDTGAMRAGIYSATAEASSYAAAASTARALNPDATIQSEVPTPAPGEAVLADVTDYALYNEFGTALRAPRPFLTPAILASEPNLIKNVREEMKRT